MEIAMPKTKTNLQLNGKYKYIYIQLLHVTQTAYGKHLVTPICHMNIRQP